MRARVSLWTPVAAYMAFIFALSSMSDVPPAPAVVSDKALHLLLYAGLGALVARALAGGWRRPMAPRRVLLVVLISALYGASDEIHQHYVPSRQMEASDLAADTLGAALAAAAAYAFGESRRT